MTGPATVKILEPTPSINPSLFESMATLVTEFEKPVTGTRVPPPENLAILSKTPVAVRIDAIAMTERVAERYAFSLSKKNETKVTKSSEKKQMEPPTKNAEMQFFNMGDEGAC